MCVCVCVNVSARAHAVVIGSENAGATAQEGSRAPVVNRETGRQHRLRSRLGGTKKIIKKTIIKSHNKVHAALIYRRGVRHHGHYRFRFRTSLSWSSTVVRRLSSFPRILFRSMCIIRVYGTSNRYLR